MGCNMNITQEKQVRDWRERQHPVDVIIGSLK